jgi:hypothetical protein
MTETPGPKDHSPNSGQKGNDTPNAKRHWLDNLAVIAAGGAAVAAAVAAGVGAWQAYVGRDTEKRQLRAYVSIAQHGIENFGQPNQVSRTIRKNYGLTPAYDLVPAQAAIDVIRIGATLPYTFNINPPPPQGGYTLFPTAEAPFEIRGHTLSQQQIALAKAGIEYQMAVWGIFYYRDAFDTSHYTRFCWLFRGEDMTESHAEACIGHNDSN